MGWLEYKKDEESQTAKQKGVRQANELSEHVIEVVSRLKLVGDFHGQPFVVRDFQKNILRRLFSKDDKGKRLIRRALLMLPRKAGKTYLCACICLYALLCGGMSQVVLAAAASQDQASRIFETMCEIIRQNASLDSRRGGLCEI